MALSSTERNAFIKASKIRGWESVRRMEYGRYLVGIVTLTALRSATGEWRRVWANWSPATPRRVR